jgi:hypothetical protein
MLSHPSGHASTSMCNMVFISVLLIRDALQIQHSLRHMFDLPYTYKAFAHVALIPVVVSLYGAVTICKSCCEITYYTHISYYVTQQLSIWIGFTRVADYWHSIGDVLVGWGLGELQEET